MLDGFALAVSAPCLSAPSGWLFAVAMPSKEAGTAIEQAFGKCLTV